MIRKNKSTDDAVVQIRTIKILLVMITIMILVAKMITIIIIEIILRNL